MSRSHRLEDNKAERERVLAGGSEVAQSEVDGNPVGPLRVWPGGLAMSRTLGDHPAGGVCTCEPDVRQVRGGLLASGGHFVAGFSAVLIFDISGFCVQ